MVVHAVAESGENNTVQLLLKSISWKRALALSGEAEKARTATVGRISTPVSRTPFSGSHTTLMSGFRLCSPIIVAHRTGFLIQFMLLGNLLMYTYPSVSFLELNRTYY